MNEQSNVAQGRRLSFLELISEFQFIEIPLLQRDYVQGRESAAGVRKRFLTGLLDALTGDKPLSMDLVYGEYNSDSFQLIDGQQRLTTLFLLHWFLACADGKLDDFRRRMRDESGKPRFRYAVRPSSHQFFAKLLDYCPSGFSTSLTEEIEDHTWFFRTWLHDPTIVGALTMIEEIRVRFASQPGFRSLYQKLAQADPPPITVDVLSLDSLDLSDEIYITLEMRLWLHAICVFFNQKVLPDGPEEIHWFRVVRNLLNNSKFDADNFSNATKSIGVLGRWFAETGSTLKVLQDLAEDASLVGLDTKQLQEERSKARLIGLSHHGSEWEAAIKQAEKHPILRGQIELLLPETDDLGTFRKRWGLFDQLLDGNGSLIGRDEYLLARAILAQSDDIKLGWQRKISFHDIGSKWSDLLDRGSEWLLFREGIRKLIDYLTGTSDLEGSLRECLKRHRSGEPWMRDIISFGGDLLSQSESMKVQNYYNKGVFLFHKANSNTRDILLGPIAALRNGLIQRLVDKSGAAWTIAASTIRLASQGEQPKVFFTDHDIKLTNKNPSGGAIFCRFEDHKLVVGSEPKFESGEISVPFPEDGGLREFHDSLNATLNLGSTDERAKTVLNELAQACLDISAVSPLGGIPLHDSEPSRLPR